MGLFGNEAESAWAKRALIDLTTTLSLPVSEIYHMIHEYEMPIAEIDGNPLFDYEYEAKKTRRRINRVAERLVVFDSENDGSVLNAPKIYDSTLQAGMIKTFNTVVASEINGSTIHKVLDRKFLSRAGVETIPKNAKYALAAQGCSFDVLLDGRDEKVSLSEMVLYASLCIVVHHRLFDVLTKEVWSQADKNRAQTLFEQINECMHSDAVHDSMVRTIISFLDEYLVSELNFEREKHIRHSWLPEQYKNRKDLERLLEKKRKKNETFQLQVKDPDDVDYSSFGERAGKVKQTDINVWLKHINSSWYLNRGERMREDIFPLVECIAMRIIPGDLKHTERLDFRSLVLSSKKFGKNIKEEFLEKDKKDCEVTIPPNIYDYACEIATFIDELIAAVLQETQDLIAYMPFSVWRR